MSKDNFQSCPKCSEGSAKQILYPVLKGDGLEYVCPFHKSNPNDKSSIVEDLREIVKDVQKRAPIKKVSEKRKKQDYQYNKKRKAFLKERPKCEADLNGCTGKATTVHHKEGRNGSKYLDESTWLPACMNCHVYIEANPAEAKEKGLSESRLRA